MKRNLLIVTPVFARWENDLEAPKPIFDLARSLSQYYRVYVLCPHSFCSAEHELIQDIQIIRFPYFLPSKWQFLSGPKGMYAHNKLNSFAKLQLPFYLIAEVIGLLKIIKKYDIHFINSHYIFPEGFSYALIRWLLPRPHIMTVHAAGVYELARHGVVGKLIARFIINRVDITLPISTYVRYTLERFTNMRFKNRIVPLGIALDDFLHTPDQGKIRRMLGLEKNKKIFLFAGDLVERSGIYTLLRAIDLLKNEHDNFLILIIGSGPLESSIKKWLSERKLDRYAMFMKPMVGERIVHYYAASDVVVIPIIRDERGCTDGLPLALQQAYASGVPVIASRLSGVNDLVEDGRNGWLFEAGNFSDLASKMSLLFTPITLKHIKAKAAETAQRYDSEHIAQQYDALLKGFYRLN